MIVTARYETPAKLAPHLEAKLREVPAGVTCTILEISHAEQLPQQPDRAEPEGRVEQVVESVSAEPADAGENGGMGGTAGEDAAGEPGGRSADDGEVGTVCGEESGFVEEQAEAQASSADSEAREDTSGDSLIVPKKRKKNVIPD